MARPPRGRRADSAENQEQRIEAAPGSEPNNWLRVAQGAAVHGSPQAALDYFRRIFDEAPAPYVVTNTDLIITDANQAALGMLKRSLTDLRENPLAVIFEPGERSVVSMIATDLLQERKPVTRPLRILTHEGEALDTVLSASVCLDQKGFPECVFWIFMHPVDSFNEDLM